MRLRKPPHTGLIHDADVSYCLFCPMSWCLSWRSWCTAAITVTIWRVRLTTLPPSVRRLSRKCWEHRRLTTLWASTACYRDSLSRKADNLTAICESSVLKMWEPRRLTTLWASTACYRDSFNILHGGVQITCIYSYSVLPCQSTHCWMLHEQHQMVSTRSNFRQWTHILLVNTPYSHLRLCRQQPSNKADIDWCVAGKVGGVHITFWFNFSTALHDCCLGCVLNSTYCTMIKLIVSRQGQPDILTVSWFLQSLEFATTTSFQFIFRF
jgi:hypothetical protein